MLSTFSCTFWPFLCLWTIQFLCPLLNRLFGNTIIINRAKLVPRTSRYGHIYYSSSMDIEDDTIDSGYTYKKIRK